MGGQCHGSRLHVWRWERRVYDYWEWWGWDWKKVAMDRERWEASKEDFVDGAVGGFRG